MKNVIAIFDIGKTNKKILLFDANLALVFQNEKKITPTVDEDGFECDDIDEITSWILNEIEAIIQKGEYNIVAVNFSTYGASLMFLDANGERLTPVYNYLKEVSPSIARNLFSNYGGIAEFCRKTASPNNGVLLNSGIQILWLREEKKESFKQTKFILHFPQYLSYMFTGMICAEPTSIGCHTFLWDFDNMKYHQWVADNNIELPQPINNNITFPVEIKGATVLVGTGIHDSSSSLVPYLAESKEPFILVSTGTWCITMNPFNSEPLTADQLEKDCLCFLTPDQKQVKSSRLFMGHFHEVWADKLAKHFDVDTKQFTRVKSNDEILASQAKRYHNKNIFFPNGKCDFEWGLENIDLNMFKSYEEAYHKLIIDLTDLAVESIELVIPEDDTTQTLFISGGFARNPIFIALLKRIFTNKKVITSEIDNASALGAAMVLAKQVNFNPKIKLSK